MKLHSVHIGLFVILARGRMLRKRQMAMMVVVVIGKAKNLM
jgi:hypothetical protein